MSKTDVGPVVVVLGFLALGAVMAITDRRDPATGTHFVLFATRCEPEDSTLRLRCRGVLSPLVYGSDGMLHEVER